ncbi:hypothetical protein H6F55_05975 [Phormidium sp. FACHB-322]|nr:MULTISPECIES: hypothetical protein [Cyanophyceae]MBD2029526.1 hypothetical protein [Phormidium sp. FACHB-322]MBD2050787.1 hypothetical protein [Leptolyngbya sp. FACHB-60]
MATSTFEPFATQAAIASSTSTAPTFRLEKGSLVLIESCTVGSLAQITLGAFW